MMPTSARLDELRQRLSALRARFGDVGARAAAAAVEVSASAAPPQGLVDDLRGTAVDFDGLRDAIVEQLSAFPNRPDPTNLTSLKALDAVLTAMERVEAEHARRAVWETARDEALAVLARVIALVHREDADSTALAECQAHARELYEGLESAPSGDVEQLDAHMRPFVELITLAEGWNRLDDEHCAALQDAITHNFGRQLGLAALRGKLGQQGEAVTEPETPPVEPLPVEPMSAEPPMAEPIATPPVVEQAPPEPVTYAPPPPPPPPVETPTVTGAPPRPSPVLTSNAAAPAADGRRAPPGSPVVVELRMSGERVQVETPEARREREALLERLAEDSARWWLGARAGWESLVQRGLPFAEAVRETLKRFPHLLSVPLSRSDEFDGGKLAEGYAILLHRLEKEEPGFVREALGRLNPQLTGRAMNANYPLGQELYLYIVAEGRLYKTFPELLRDVMVHALPEPGLWLQAAITEADDATTIVTRPEQPGGRREESRRLTVAAERFTSHAFSVKTEPLTARVFSVQADELAEPIDLEIHLKENEAPTDRAWIVVAPMAGKPEAPRKQRAGGTKLERLGKDTRAVWIAAFNSDPNAEKTYELTVTLKRRVAASAPPRVEPQAAPSSGKSSVFKKR